MPVQEKVNHNIFYYITCIHLNILILDLFTNSVALMETNQFIHPINLNNSFSLSKILTRENYARTTVIVDTGCPGSVGLLREASFGRYFNKTYQWLLWGVEHNIHDLLPLELEYVGPNAQLTYLNRTKEGGFAFWDVHSKGRQLKAPLELNLIAKLLNNVKDLLIFENIFELQSIKYRSQFNGLVLRGASVVSIKQGIICRTLLNLKSHIPQIDQENIVTNAEIEAILSRPTKDAGVAAFIKYHYELLSLLRDRFNFTVNFRNSRGWAGRLGNTTFRLGLLGIIMRNEADIAASGAFNRINRFAEFDTIHQSWKFETAFLFRFTPDLDTHGKSGNFLAPFSRRVWLFTLATLIIVNVIWFLLQWANRKLQQRFTVEIKDPLPESSWTERTLHTFGAVCQQGMEPIPSDMPARSVVVTIFLFSVVMYNYYTSSVVGGLLSSSEQGPATVDEITASSLKISFEDIGYYKVLFRVSIIQNIV